MLYRQYIEDTKEKDKCCIDSIQKTPKRSTNVVQTVEDTKEKDKCCINCNRHQRTQKAINRIVEDTKEKDKLQITLLQITQKYT